VLDPELGRAEEWWCGEVMPNIGAGGGEYPLEEEAVGDKIETRKGQSLVEGCNWSRSPIETTCKPCACLGGVVSWHIE